MNFTKGFTKVILQKKHIFISIIIIIVGINFYSCKKHTSNIIRGRWEKVMIDTAYGDQTYGHRYLIKQVWDFRDFKYVFLESTMSGQALATPANGLDPFPINVEDRRVYEIPKRRELNLIKEGNPPYVENYIINELNDDVLSMTRFENGKNAGVVEFMRIKD